MNYLIHGWIRARQNPAGPKNRKAPTVRAGEIIVAEMDSPAEKNLVRSKTGSLHREIAEETRGHRSRQAKLFSKQACQELPAARKLRI